MEQLVEIFIEGRSYRHSDGRDCWVQLRMLRSAVYSLWDYWPMCEFPDKRPPLPKELVNLISRFASFRGIQLTEPARILKLQWSHDNWSQLEICTRHFALLIDEFFEAYECRQENTDIFGGQIKFIKYMKTLLDHIVHWWLYDLLL